MTTLAEVWAVVITHRDVDRAVRCACSLGLPVDRVIIVANLPPPAGGTEPWTTVSPPTPQGYAANINLGVAQAPAGTRWLLLLNDDVVFEPQTLERLLTAACSERTVAAITPALYGVDRRPQVVAFRHPTMASEIAGVLSGPEFLRRALRKGDSVMPSERGVTIEDWVLGAAVVVRAAAFAAVGGFDERYFMYSEDTQFGLDLQRAGWRSAVLHDAWALHVGAVSTNDPQWGEMLGASRRRYLRNNWSRLRFAALCALWLVAQVWNAAYLLTTSIHDPSRRNMSVAHARAQLCHPPWR
ncbi:MAG: glycosyltransferase [Actinomycetota bacterium]|nr:glycosyltransferase [Actinomycetota bacterium]